MQSTDCIRTAEEGEGPLRGTASTDEELQSAYLKMPPTPCTVLLHLAHTFWDFYLNFPSSQKNHINSKHNHSRDAGAEPRAPTAALNAGECSPSVQSAQGIRPQKAVVHGQEAIGKGSKERKEHSTANITLFC